MPYSTEHKQRSREKILASAIRLFSNKGYDGVTIDQLMTDAGLTRGAFYAHFGSKSELYAEAVLAAAMQSPIASGACPGEEGRDWVRRTASLYLSREHLEQEDFPCPLAFLATDVANREPAVRNTYTRVYAEFVRVLQSHLPTEASTTKGSELSWAMAALMIGGVAVCRALNDETTIDRVLVACRQAVEGLVEEAG